MKTTISKFELLNAFANGLPFTVGKVTFKVLNGIERESGSNLSYNVSGYDQLGQSAKAFTYVH